MKKRRFFTLALLSAAVILISSCSKDDDDNEPLGPSLTVTESLTGSTGGAVEITEGAPLVFAWETRKGENDLETFSISQTGSNVTNPLPETYQAHEIPYDVTGDDKSIYIDTIAFNNASINPGTTNYSFTVTDEAGISQTVSFDVLVEEADTITELIEPILFTWTREGSDPATGLEIFGLKWTQNTSTSAIVAIDEATKLVNLGSSAWDDIQTQGELADEIDMAAEIDTYEGVSVTENDVYDDVLGVRHDNINYLIHITDGTVVTSTSGTTVSISGAYKK